LRIISILNRSRTSSILIAAFFIVALFYPLLGAEEQNMQSPFGVLEFLNWNHGWNNYKYATAEDLEKAVALMKEAGVSWVRTDFLWEEIEPEAGRFEFAKYDHIMGLLHKNGFNVLGVLGYSATWAVAGKKWNSPPDDISLFVNFAKVVISRYKDRVKYWEIWNEPDSPTYWEPQDGLKTYCGLLKEVYLAAKKEAPDCKVLNGGLASGLSSVNKLYDNGCGAYFDILNIHIFDSPLNRNALHAVAAYPKLAYKVMARNGDGHKKIWVTETGCPGVKSGLKAANWWMGKNPGERQQAEWVKKVYAGLLKDKNVEAVFWAFFRDTKEHWNNGTDYFGLVRWDFSKKPSFKAYQKAVSAWKKSQ